MSDGMSEARRGEDGGMEVRREGGGSERGRRYVKLCH